MNTVASPCPGPGLFSQHRNGMSLVVMRFLTLGSTPSIPNQPPKIISTGNAFLTSGGKKKKKNLQILDLFYSCMCVHLCVSSMFCPYCRDCGVDITKWHRTPQRIIFFNAVEVRGALAGDLFSESALYCYSTKRGSHKRLMSGGEGGWGVRGGERAGSDEPQPKRKTHSFSSAG